MTDLEAMVSIASTLLRVWYTDQAQHTDEDLAAIVRKVSELMQYTDSAARTMLEADAIRELQRRLKP